MKAIVILVIGLLFSGAMMASPDTNKASGLDRESRYYNPKTTETLRGEVIAVEELSQSNDMGHGVHLMVKTDKETLPVHLGPSWFLLDQKVQIRQGDIVRIDGSRAIINQKPVIIAGKITKGTSVLKLRDKNGIPVWAGRKQQ